MEIYFTKHAREKFSVLVRHGVRISEKKVRATIEAPEHIDYSRLPLLIAQAPLDRLRVSRVVYRVTRNSIVVITFYPGRRLQYER